MSGITSRPTGRLAYAVGRDEGELAIFSAEVEETPKHFVLKFDDGTLGPTAKAFGWTSWVSKDRQIAWTPEQAVSIYITSCQNKLDAFRKSAAETRQDLNDAVALKGEL